ncbi:hypothetical protein ID866_13044 [Astraeus odoratus]|nr:hypothetical protein ID866_13044 [Astraeus odoratus]
MGTIPLNSSPPINRLLFT